MSVIMSGRRRPGVTGYADLVVGSLTLLATFAVVMGLLAWLGTRVRRRRGRASDAFMGPFEEIWHPAAHRARFETEAVEERVVPVASADDRLRRRGGPAR